MKHHNHSIKFKIIIKIHVYYATALGLCWLIWTIQLMTWAKPVWSSIGNSEGVRVVCLLFRLEQWLQFQFSFVRAREICMHKCVAHQSTMRHKRIANSRFPKFDNFRRKLINSAWLWRANVTCTYLVSLTFIYFIALLFWSFDCSKNHRH